MTSHLSHVRHACYDFDGVFYATHKIPSYSDHFSHVYAITLCSLFPRRLAYNEAYKMNEDGFKQYGDSVTYMLEWALINGLHYDDLKNEFFVKYHENLLNHFLTVEPAIVNNSPELRASFARSHGSVKRAVATHGCATSWAIPLLDRKGLLEYMERHAIIGLNDAEFRKKSVDPTLVEMAFARLGVAPKDGVFTEDTADNLKLIKAHHPDIKTAFLHHGKPFERLPSYIDGQYSDLLEFEQAFESARENGPRIFLP